MPDITELQTTISAHFRQSADVKYNSAESLSVPIAQAIERICQSLNAGGKVMACGNGGSAADAQHFAAEFVGRFERERPELAGLALTTDTSILTAVGNDYGYNEIFSKQVRGLGVAGDILVAISSSGNSESILRAIAAAHAKDMTVVALSGRGGGKFNDALKASDIHICVPHEKTARVQEVHILALHCICDGVDTVLLGES